MDFENQFQLSRYLCEEGLVPDECKDIQILFPADGIVEVVFRCNMTNERLEKFQRAFKKYLELSCTRS